MARLTESDIESATLTWLEAVGWQVKHGAEIAPGELFAERADYGEVVLAQRLRDALARLNPDLPAEALEDAFRKVARPDLPAAPAAAAQAGGADLILRNRALHRLLVDGVTVEYRAADGAIRGAQARVLDFDAPAANDWLAVNQFTVVENKHERRPDVVLFVNGLPLAVLELKNAADEDATIWTAWQQLRTYQTEIASLFATNAVLVISDGVQARAGTLTAGREWFKPWRTISGETLADAHVPELQVVTEGLLAPRRFLDLVRDFIVFEDEGGGRLAKKMAGYHQFHAVQVAVRETLRAAELVRGDCVAEAGGRYEAGRKPGGKPGDRRVGVVWHTQGSGKSLTMAFYAGRIVREPAMENPTLVVLTDRNDLDDQLFGTFSRCQDLLRQPPVQAESRVHLRQLLSVQAGGVVFTTIHKFFPEEKGDLPAAPSAAQAGRHPTLSERRNIVVIADEAHRSQYDFIDGFARHMRDALPNASFIGFTGTPIEKADANTRAVFGDYISVYDIQRAVEDGATVPIYYESRLAKLALDEAERPKIDPDFEEVTEGEELERKEKLKTKWAQLEAIVGAEKRLKLVAQDIVEHFEKRLEAMDGKAMVVCMSRRICVELYREIVRLRPGWHDDDDARGSVKVVMTGSASDPADWQPHIRNKPRREALANRFRLPAEASAQAGDPNEPFRIVLVRDMWLTGFDAPSLHTMYIDKPMRGHGLMQAIARVNRVFKDKPGGLVVDYLGLAHELKAALATYTESGGTGRTALYQEEAVAVMLEKYEVCCGLFHLPAPPPSPFYVYAIECEDGSLYIGQTDDLTRRWQEHKAGTASEWTKGHRPIRIAHYELASTREQACKMESDWKTGFGRKRLKRLIEKGGARQAGGFDRGKWVSGTPQERLALLPAAQEHILAQENGKDRCVRAVRELSQAFALAVPHDEALRIRDDVAFFQAVAAVLAKRAPGEARPEEELDHAVRQIISRAVAPEGVVDIFAAAGLAKPDISILSEEFLAEVRGMPQRNLAVELLQKLLRGELATRRRKNLVQARSFAEMLEQTIRRYQNRAIEAAQVIEELIALARDMREASARGEKLNLSEEELAFYDALETNDSAVKVLGDETLRTIARELVTTVRNNVTIDWTLRENVRAQLRVLVKRILRKYGYPPDKQEKATQTVLEQAALLSAEWAAA
ncbi:MAG TPA: type I restriction endonuclease subunit R [Anaerolineae bacterium]|nr:type I restriction endonuclease subunit R [Anaerolineae bacterium]